MSVSSETTVSTNKNTYLLRLISFFSILSKISSKY
jgi:hypothetical protein